MKNTIYLLLVIIILVSGCEGAYPKEETTVFNVGDDNFKVIEIDSCEYILSVTYGGRNVASHKGNCKYCAVRSKITSQFPQGVDSIKFVGNTFEVFKSGKKYTVEL